MKLDKISPKVYANTEGKTGGNVGIVVLDSGVAAVDAQYPVSGADFRRSIPKVTGSPSPTCCSRTTTGTTSSAPRPSTAAGSSPNA